MKRKEIKNLAKKIGEQELIIKNADDPKVIARAQDLITELGAKVESFEDMIMLDEAIQDFLNKNF